MELRIHANELQDALDNAVADALGDHFDLDRPLAVNEATAARLLGVNTHQLRDLRLKGDVQPRKAGRSYLYSKACLLAFLNQNVDR